MYFDIGFLEYWDNYMIVLRRVKGSFVPIFYAVEISDCILSECQEIIFDIFKV